MPRRRHPSSTDKVAQLAWNADDTAVIALADAPTAPVAPRVALRLPDAAPRIAAMPPLPPRIAATPPLPPYPARARIAGTPMPRGSSPQLGQQLGQQLQQLGQPHGPRGSSPVITNPLGQPVFVAPPLVAMPAMAALPAPFAPKRRRDRLGYVVAGIAGACVAGGLVAFGGQLWLGVRGPVPAAAEPAVTVALADGQLALSADRREVIRLAGDAPRWRAPQPDALAALAITGPIALGRHDDAIVAIDLDTGRTRFDWAPPGDERWAEAEPVATGTCLLVTTRRGARDQLRCLDLDTGSVRWTAPVPAAKK